METIKIIGIDPGNNTGISIYTLSLPDFKIINIDSRLYQLDTFINPIDSIFYNKMMMRCQILYNIVTSLLKEYDPVAIAYESAFLNAKYANAVIQLTQYTSTIEQAIFNYNTFIRIFKYPPKWIKKYVGAGGTADKDDMLINLSTLPELQNLQLPINLSEHEIDAISIGYVLYKDILLQHWILYML